MALYPVAGLDEKIELSVPLHIVLIPPWQTNQRPGHLLSEDPLYIQHGTGNRRVGAGALMHLRYMQNGAEGQQLGYHFTNDDEAAYQMIPITEGTWHAGDGGGPGNMNGIGCEQCENPDQDFAKTRRVSAELAGGVMRAKGMPLTSLKRHWDMNWQQPASIRHHCPDRMMNGDEGPYEKFVLDVDRIRTFSGAPEPVRWAVPALPPNWEEVYDDGEDFEFNGVVWEAMNLTYTAKDDLVRRAWGSDDAPRTGPNVPHIDPRTGEPSRVRGYRRVKAANGRRYVVTRMGSRIRASALSPYVTVKR